MYVLLSLNGVNVKGAIILSWLVFRTQSHVYSFALKPFSGVFKSLRTTTCFGGVSLRV